MRYKSMTLHMAWEAKMLESQLKKDGPFGELGTTMSDSYAIITIAVGNLCALSYSDGMAGVRITEIGDNGRPVRHESPRRDRGDRREGRRSDRDDVDGYDFYR